MFSGIWVVVMNKFIPKASYGERNPGIVICLIKEKYGYTVSPYSIDSITNNEKVINKVSHTEQSIKRNRKEIEREFNRMLSEGDFNNEIVDMIIKLRSEVFREEYMW